MGYYILSQDKTFRNQVVIDKSRLPEELRQLGYPRRKNYSEWNNSISGDKCFNLVVKSNADNYYSDFIENPYLLISDELKKVFISY